MCRCSLANSNRRTEISMMMAVIYILVYLFEISKNFFKTVTVQSSALTQLGQKITTNNMSHEKREEMFK